MELYPSNKFSKELRFQISVSGVLFQIVILSGLKVCCKKEFIKSFPVRKSNLIFVSVHLIFHFKNKQSPIISAGLSLSNSSHICSSSFSVFTLEKSFFMFSIISPKA
jgi:hypothetical protein